METMENSNEFTTVPTGSTVTAPLVGRGCCVVKGWSKKVEEVEADSLPCSL